MTAQGDCMESEKFYFIKLNQNTKTIILTTIPAGIVVKIGYAAIRGQSNEPGAVQRVLNPSRISSIKQFALEVGDFPGVIILNWINKEFPLEIGNNELTLPLVERAAQIIDGQHRLAGIKAAIEANTDIAKLQLPVAIYENLTTPQCADIFLSINTEQKPVPKSLVFDLYGIASEPTIDAAATRARDIAIFLNEEENSPYKDGIKLPGSPRKKGGVALSTAVTALKDIVEEKGTFEQIGVTELELQQRIILNYFSVLREKYEKEWDSMANAFMYSSGFMGAIDFFKLKLINYCSNNRSFQKEIISSAIQMSFTDRILQSEVKGLGGKDAQKKIYERLNDMFTPDSSSSNAILV